MAPPVTNKRSVRFIESTTTDQHQHQQSQQPPQKRSRPVDNSHNEDGEEKGPTSVLRPSSHKVNHRGDDRVNQDELDDIEDWNARDDEDVDTGGLPSQSQLIEAKRKRREQRGGIFDDDNNNNNKHHLDETEASLAKDGVKIEPFHMREEETDGSGYFDGDTYVFRNNVLTEDGEADAWADTLMKDGNGQAGGDDDDDGPKISIARNRAAAAARNKSTTTAPQEDLDELSKEELYQRIVPLMGGARESIMAAIRRYGTLAKPKFHSKNRRNQQKQPNQQETKANDSTSIINVAKSHLDDLTGAANALLLKGEVDIYDRTRQSILRLYPSLSDTADAKPSIATATSKPKWEYQGNEDHQLHGPYTTDQMIGWVRSGYFVGAQRVKIRTITTSVEEEEKVVVEPPQLSTEEDLMADLMDDDDDDEEEEESRPVKKARDAQSTTITVKGQWMWSNEIEYRKYL
jgi:CD2 antigen cytoplasmic tail-binding protein 2